MHPRLITQSSDGKSSITGKSMTLPEPCAIEHVRIHSGRGTGARFMKHAFDGHTVGTMGGQQRGKLGVDSRETVRECVARRRCDGAAGHEHVTASIRLHAAVAGALGAGIDAENSHAREASISFSSMSKFAQTC